MERVFVYGSLRKGGYNSFLLRNSEFIKKVKTKEPMSLWDLGAFPAVTFDPTVQITGEVYEVDKETLHRLDALEGYPNFYDRTQILLEDESKAWIYFLHHINPKDKLISNGDYIEYSIIQDKWRCDIQGITMPSSPIFS